MTGAARPRRRRYRLPKDAGCDGYLGCPSYCHIPEPHTHRCSNKATEAWEPRLRFPDAIYLCPSCARSLLQQGAVTQVLS